MIKKTSSKKNKAKQRNKDERVLFTRTTYIVERGEGTFFLVYVFFHFFGFMYFSIFLVFCCFDIFCVFVVNLVDNYLQATSPIVI